MDRNCLSYWFPRLQAAGVPVPRTEVVRWPGPTWDLAALCDGKTPDGFDQFLAELKAAALRVGPGPWFLRTGQGSGKHDWARCCHLTDLERLSHHVGALVEWSHLVDMLGLRHDVWAVREMLPVEPVAALPRYNGMPLVKEVRAFVADGKVRCGHPYWPPGAVRQGLELHDAHRAAGLYAALECTPEDYLAWSALVRRVAEAFAGDGTWSVDVLATRDGWYITDMAEAERSFHWPGCPNAN